MTKTVKRLSPKRETVFGREVEESTSSINSDYLKEASPEVLGEIRRQIAERKKKDRKKFALVFAVSLLILFVLYWFVDHLIVS